MGRGQRGNNTAYLIGSSPLSNELWCETGSFSHYGGVAVVHSQLWVSVFPLSQPLPQSPLSLAPSSAPMVCCMAMVFLSWPTGPHHGFLLVWLFWLIFSLIPWLLEFHAVWFSGTFRCLLILDWLLSSFCLCVEVKGFYLCLHLGQNLSYATLDWKSLELLSKLSSCCRWVYNQNYPTSFITYKALENRTKKKIRPYKFHIIQQLYGDYKP